MTVWQVVVVTLLGALSSALWWQGENGVPASPRGLAARLPDVALARQALTVMRRGRLTARQRAALQAWLALAAVGLGLILLPFSRPLTVVVAGPVGLAAALFPWLFRGEVTIWRAARLEEELLPFFAHVLLRLPTETLLEALASYGRCFDGVLAEEMRRVVDAFHLGRPLPEALGELADRYESAHLRRFAAAVEELLSGERPAEMMAYFFDDLLAQVRAERLAAVRRRVMVATTVGVLLILPAVLVIIFEPAVVMFLRNFR